MSPSKLDPHQKARDFRRTKRRHKRHNEKPPLPVHVDVTSVTYASQLVDDGSRFTVVDVLPEMDEEWINEIVFVRSPTTGTPDRSFMGIQMLDDSLAWIELTLAAPAPPNEGNAPPTPDPSGMTWIRHYGEGTLGSYSPSTYSSFRGVSVDPGVNGSTTGGYVWVTDPPANRFFAINPTTAARGTTVTGTIPTAIAHNGVSNDIFVVEDRRNQQSLFGGTNQVARIRQYTKTGTLIGALISSASISEPYMDIAVNPAGTHLYVCDYANDRVRKVTISSGAVALNITHASLIRPRGVHVSAAGIVYVSSGDVGNNQLVIFNESGTFQANVGTSSLLGLSTDGNFSAPEGVWSDPYNRFYAVDRGNHRVQIFNATTRAFVDKFGALGIGDGQFENPFGISGVDLGSGSVRLFVHDAGGGGITPRISVWDVDNTV